MRRFDRYDRAWWQYFFAVMTRVRRMNRNEVIRVRLAHTLAGLSNGGLTSDSHKKLTNVAKEQYYDLVGTIMPWEGLSFVDFKRNELDEARQAYIDAFNVDPLDPAFKSWEAEQIEALNRGDFEPAPTEDEKNVQVIQERLRQRMAAGK